jgi:hypothetical protein
VLNNSMVFKNTAWKAFTGKRQWLNQCLNLSRPLNQFHPARCNYSRSVLSGQKVPLLLRTCPFDVRDSIIVAAVDPERLFHNDIKVSQNLLNLSDCTST